MCHPIVQVPANADGSCPRGTRKRRGACIRTVGDVNAVNALHSPRIPVAIAPVAHDYPIPVGLPADATQMILDLIPQYNGLTRHVQVITNTLRLCDNKPVAVRTATVQYLVAVFNRLVRDNYPMDITTYRVVLNRWCKKLCKIYGGLAEPSLIAIQTMLVQITRLVLENSLTNPVVHVSDIWIRSILTFPPGFVHNVHYQSFDERDPRVEAMHDALRDYGAYMTPDGIVYLIPVAFFHVLAVPLPNTRVVPPAHMSDLEDYVEIPFQANRPGHVCVVIEDGHRTRAFSIPLETLRKGINPRTPMWMFMKCKGPSHSYNVNDVMVYSDKLYLDLAKTGVPEHAYLDINELTTALDAGHRYIVIKATEVTQIASAYLYKVVQNAVSASHCEIGHTGQFYNLFLPV